MAVFTQVTLEDLLNFLPSFNLGKALKIDGISSGTENSNFLLGTDRGEYILTLFEKLDSEEILFYLKLMSHLSKNSVLVPEPITDLQGNILHYIHGKPAVIVTKLEGISCCSPTRMHCSKVGAMMAKMHQSTKNFNIHKPNSRGLGWWKQTFPTVISYLPENSQRLLCSEISFQENFSKSKIYSQLPKGLVHGDLFRNNVMFNGKELTGFFDFYFAGFDTFLFDLAVTVNDWCVDLTSGSLDHNRVRAMLDAYHEIRPFDTAEQSAWNIMLRAGALRFWLSRLYDFHLPRAAEILTPHDPYYFQQILQQRIDHVVPALY